MCPHCLFRQSPTLGLKHPIADVRRALGAHPCAAPVQSDRHVPGAPHPSAEADHCRVLGVVPVAILREVPGSAQAHLKSLPPGKLPSSHLRRTGQPCASRLPNSAQSTRDGSRPGVNRLSGCHWPSMPGGDRTTCLVALCQTARHRAFGVADRCVLSRPPPADSTASRPCPLHIRHYDVADALPSPLQQFLAADLP